jgi:hypothetical protein
VGGPWLSYRWIGGIDRIQIMVSRSFRSERRIRGLWSVRSSLSRSANGMRFGMSAGL